MLEEITVQCPHCGEDYITTVDTSEGGFTTVEDCTVCCRPMTLVVDCTDGKVEQVSVSAA